MRQSVDVPTATRARQQELRGLLTRKLEFIDRKWDFFFFLTAAFAVAAAADMTRLLFAGDWDFWVDWKDRQWWPIVTPIASIIIPSAIQYIVWVIFRMPMGASISRCLLYTPPAASRRIAAVHGRAPARARPILNTAAFAWPAQRQSRAPVGGAAYGPRAGR